MDFGFFQSLDDESARSYLNRYLQLEQSGIEELRPAAEKAGVVVDYSISSVVGFLLWTVRNVKIKRVPISESEPQWIRDAHKEGLIEFDEYSKIIVLRASFYLGESFVRSNRLLSWSIGNPEYAQKNMPVVVGFARDEELPTILVVENLFLRILGDGATTTDVERAVSYWKSLV